jgi:nucleotide-binding universal stress UspA family protein
MKPYSHLLVPTDGSELSGAAVDHALKLAATIGARITFLHAQPNVPLPVMGMGEMLDARTMDALLNANRKDTERILADAEKQAHLAGVPASTEGISSDQPHRAIIDAAERLNCDLIVMASHGRGGLSGLLLGSETQRVLVHARCPVLVYR